VRRASRRASLLCGRSAGGGGGVPRVRQLKLPPRRAVEVRTHRRLRTHVRAPGLFDLRTGWPPLLKRLGYCSGRWVQYCPKLRVQWSEARRKSAMWLSLGLGLGDALLAGPGVACGKGCSYAVRVCARPPPFLSPRVGVHSQAPLPRALSTASPVTQAVRPALLPQRATFCRAVSQPAPQPYSQAALNVMFPTRDQDKQPSRPTGSWWPVRWRFPSKKQVVLAGVMTCALLLASYLLAVAGSIAPLSTVAAEGSLLAGAVNTFSSSAGSGAGGAFLPVAAMIFLQPQDRFFQDRARN
jgi:hypothetical protein